MYYSFCIIRIEKFDRFWKIPKKWNQSKNSIYSDENCFHTFLELHSFSSEDCSRHYKFSVISIIYNWNVAQIEAFFITKNLLRFQNIFSDLCMTLLVHITSYLMIIILIRNVNVKANILLFWTHAIFRICVYLFVNIVQNQHN